MKIGIVTVFNAVNYGSFLQAFCLQEKIKELGCDDIEMVRTSSPLYEKWRFTSLFTYKPKKMSFKFRLAKGYFSLWKRFTICKSKKHTYDLLIVGSDEMWELNNITMTPLPEFFGVGIKANKKATYAVSSNSTKKTDIERYDFVKKGLKEFDAVSVRDQSTYNAYAPYLKTEPCFSVDPTLLVDLNRYAVETSKENYILCYTYSFDDYMIKKVEDLAEKTGKRIIVAGQNWQWPDECIPANAFEFLGLIKNADFVVTDTFHGTTLSIGLRKQFVSFAYKTKVYRALELFGLLDRNAGEDTDLLEKYEDLIDYPQIYNDFIDPLREQSVAYLRGLMKE